MKTQKPNSKTQEPRLKLASWIFFSLWMLSFPAVSMACGGGGGGAPPTPNFSASPICIDTGGTVVFTDQSSGYLPTSWSWTFQGGTPGTSILQHPTVVYSTAGVYDVTLTATNAYGSSVPLTKTAYITCSSDSAPLPAAAITASPTTLCEGGAVSFTNQSASCSPVTGGGWTFPGGTPGTSIMQNPTVVYNTAGTYTASFTISNANGSDTATQIITVQTCTGIQQVGWENDITVFPSISEGRYSVVSGFEITGIVVFSSIGEKVFEASPVNATAAAMDISEFADGIYLAKITCGNIIVHKKIIKQ